MYTDDDDGDNVEDDDYNVDDDSVFNRITGEYRSTVEEFVIFDSEKVGTTICAKQTFSFLELSISLSMKIECNLIILRLV